MAVARNKPCKAGFVGGPGSGKTLAALELTVQLKLLGYDARYLEEYATEYFEQTGPPMHFRESREIMDGQVEMEERAVNPKTGKTRDFVICGSTSFMPCVYARHYPPSDLDDLRVRDKYNHLVKKLDDRSRKELIPSYDFIFFLPIEHAYRTDAVRYQDDEEEAKEIERKFKEFLNDNHAKYHVLSGTLEERVRQALAVLLSEKEFAPPI